MDSHLQLLARNKIWAEGRVKEEPDFFNKMKSVQQPEFLWIGCSDSRVPAENVTGTEPGNIFVHRNIANLVVNNDMNLLSVLDYAVSVLKVKHIIVCGHYGCGGVVASMDNTSYGFVDSWLRNIKDVYFKYKTEVDAIKNETARRNRLVELNVIEQVRNLAKTKIVQRAWQDGSLKIHGWVYGMEDGLITDLDVVFDAVNDIDDIYHYNNL